MGKITDEEWARAVAFVEGSEAKYELSVACRRRGAEMVIATFEKRGSGSKRIPWIIDGSAASRRIQMRIDQDRAFTSVLIMHGYGNQGQIISPEVQNIVRSSRLVFADVFPDEQVEVVTNYPPKFRRLCELLVASGS